MHPYWLERLFFGLAWPEFPCVQVGDVVAVNQPGENPYLTKVLHAEGGARTADPNFLQVVREPDCAVMNICPSWITSRILFVGNEG